MAQDKIVFSVNSSEFEEKVVTRSRQTPVVVDFWAEWCAPCLMLGPALEKVVRSYKGEVLLAKLNVDQNPGIASRYAIQSIPAVKIFRDGKVASEFVGAVPEAEVKRLIAASLPSPADRLANQGMELLEQKDASQAEKRFREALDADPNHPGANVALAQMLLDRAELEQAHEHALKVEPSASEFPRARQLISRIDFIQHCQQSGGMEGSARRFEENQQSLDAQYGYACCLAAEGRYENALQALLTIVKANKQYRDGAARDAMVRIFSLVGERSELADRHRSELAQALY